MPRRNSRTLSTNAANPNLTPLLDIVLQLITFFMMLVHFGSRLEGSTRMVRLPLAPAALPGSDLTFDRLAVVLDAQGRLRVGGQSLDEEAAIGVVGRSRPRSRRAGLETLGDRPPRMNLPTVVILRADRAASYGAVRRTLERPRKRASPISAWSSSIEANDEHGSRYGMGLILSGPESSPTTVRTDAIDPDAPRSRRYRPGPPEEVSFPVAPDARHGVPAPGLLHPDLQGPLGRDPHRPGPARDAGRLADRVRRPGPAPAVPERRHRPRERPAGPRRVRRPGRPQGLATGRGHLCPTWPRSASDLRRYTQLLNGRPLRVRLVADDRLRYEPAARIIATCSAAGVAAIRLAPPAQPRNSPRPRAQDEMIKRTCPQMNADKRR